MIFQFATIISILDLTFSQSPTKPCEEGNQFSCKSYYVSVKNLNKKKYKSYYFNFETGHDSSKCIALDKVCNGFQDCPDKSDEKGCFIECRFGSKHHFQCQDGKCHSYQVLSMGRTKWRDCRLTTKNPDNHLVGPFWLSEGK